MMESLMRVSRGLVEAIGNRDAEEIERLTHDRGVVLGRLMQWERDTSSPAVSASTEVQRQLREDDAAIVRGLELMKREILQNIESLNRKRKLTSYMDEARR
jgi:hypothetical protein